MSFQAPISIKEAIDNLDHKRYVLPSIQREFVWKTEQIERLFDSIMKGYPVGSFLFWTLQGDNIQNYEFYDFIRDYHERDNRHNPKANSNGVQNLIAILDGQQRLTSLYIGLKGSYAEKLPYKRSSNNSAYEKKHLYLNIAKPSDKPDSRYDFRFLSKKEVDSSSNGDVWYLVGDILNLNGLPDIFAYITKTGLTSNYASECLTLLYQQFVTERGVNYYLEKGSDLDRVLNIFIRVNSGGTQLSYSDLLLSIATALWENEDARESVTNLVDEVNQFGAGFDFDKDIILKACLVLCDFPDIAFKVGNFNKATMQKIEAEWAVISSAIRLAVKVLASFGFNHKTLTANYVMIPLAYYIYKNQCPTNFDEAGKYAEDRQHMRKFTIVALLKRIFGGQPDNVLRPIREILKTNVGAFRFETIRDSLKITNKSLKVEQDDINDLLYTKYGNNYAFSLLSLLYPTLDYRNIFHQDHIFPRSLLRSQFKLKRLGLTDDQVGYCFENADFIGNLQLLEGTPNIEKSDIDFQQWLNKKYPDSQLRADYMAKHYIPTSVSLSVDKFQTFLEERESLLIAKLEELLL